uniref:Cell wall hydrolase/autolysin n=1 Tax=Paulinella chromatophora TaxID=39717 RepID=B1X592_PAUCH|nr:Cell wall hydrolase/autolysin [Paulinella chromatophora]ACB43111.1 Cell wall hydrolase/autolysin [Paulinella chromatophora]
MVVSLYSIPLSILSSPYKVVIDPGHGGPDPGAIGTSGLRETDVVLDLGLRVAQFLQGKGVQPILTRSLERSDVDLPLRVNAANHFGATAFISIHANAVNLSRPDVNGIETFYCQNPLSHHLAKEIQRCMLRASPKTPNRGVRKGRFFVIRRTRIPSTLLETGFLTGNIDGPRLATPEHRGRIAKAIANGIMNYIKDL